MEISIEYLEKEITQPSIFYLSPEQYYDPIEEGETFENDAIPKFNYESDYLDIPLNRLLWTKLNICGTNEDRVIITHYFNDGNTWMSHRKDHDGYEELIHSTQLDNKTCHIIRTQKNQDGIWKINTNVVVLDMEDGSQEEVFYNEIL